ncbi:MAG: hypothetical protein ACTS9Y_00865 [Methylophilus sp.]|uniref:hypothetical protein n=1 Tax=Methylophilus sp. TaxID=29541 RepID=UPI003F9F5830
MDQQNTSIEKDRILSKLNNETRSHIEFVCDEYDDINDVITNFCDFLTHVLHDTDGNLLATNIISKAFKHAFPSNAIPTLKEYANRPNLFKLSLFNELSILSRYNATGIDLLSGEPITWNPRLVSFSQWSSGRVKSETLKITITNPVDTSTDFRISVAIQIFDCIQFIQEDIVNA